MEWICMIAWAPPWKMIEVNGVGLIFDLPLFKTSHIQSCTIAAHSILTSCCFTTSTSAKEKKYKRQWKVNYLSLCWTPNLFVISISAFSGLLVGSLFWKGVSAKLRNPHRRSKKEVWVTPCLLLETWIEPRWMVKYQKKQCYNFHAYCPPSKLEGRKGRQMVGSTRSIQIVRCVKASRSSTSIIFMRNFSFKTLHPF